MQAPVLGGTQGAIDACASCSFLSGRSGAFMCLVPGLAANQKHQNLVVLKV
jgi:hypothetical protein